MKFVNYEKSKTWKIQNRWNRQSKLTPPLLEKIDNFKNYFIKPEQVLYFLHKKCFFYNIFTEVGGLFWKKVGTEVVSVIWFVRLWYSGGITDWKDDSELGLSSQEVITKQF